MRDFPTGTACLYTAATLVMIIAAGPPFVYPLDDTYIHLAIGRTLATTGIWGAQPTDPAAASSSPLWSLILAGAYLVWPKRWADGFVAVPLLLNLVAGAGVLGLWYTILAGVRLRGLCILLLWLAVPLGTLSMLGMEHITHVLLATTLAWAGARAIADDVPRQLGVVVAGPVALGAVAALAVAVRYESLFLITPLAALALVRRRVSVAVALSVGSAITVLGFGALWVAQGGWMLPNPLLLKGINREDIAAGPLLRLAGNLGGNLRHQSGPAVVALALGLAGLVAADWRRGPARWRWRPLLAGLALSATGLQLLLASIGWLYRYDAWLIALDGLAAILLLDALLAWRDLRMFAVALALIAVVVLPRTAVAVKETIQSVDDRRLEHLLPAEFVRGAYEGHVVLVNDLGMIAYLGSVRALDMSGLGNNQPLRLRRDPESFDTTTLRRWVEAEGAVIAVLQLCWSEVHRRLPPEWPLVAVWRVPRNVLFGDHIVGFLAIMPGEAERLRAALEAFPLPSSVSVRYQPDPALAAYMRAEDRTHQQDLDCWYWQGGTIVSSPVFQRLSLRQNRGSRCTTVLVRRRAWNGWNPRQ